MRNDWFDCNAPRFDCSAQASQKIFNFYGQIVQTEFLFCYLVYLFREPCISRGTVGSKTILIVHSVVFRVARQKIRQKRLFIPFRPSYESKQTRTCKSRTQFNAPRRDSFTTPLFALYSGVYQFKSRFTLYRGAGRFIASIYP